MRPLALLLFATVAFAEPKKKPDLRSLDLHILTTEGAATKIGPYAGTKLTLVNLWATWCGPCREEMPALDSLHKKYKPRGFQVVGLDVDEPAAKVKAFMSGAKVTYPILLTTPEVTMPALGTVEALPTSLLLDEHGAIIELIEGGIEEKEMGQLIEHYLAGKKPKK